jgi:type IV pilus assembly protein PilN
MKIPINLASQPFRRDRAMVFGSALVSVLLLVTLGMLIYLSMLDRALLADLRKDIAHLNQQVRTVNAEQSKYNAVLRKPENAVVLERSLLINNLLIYKSVSWSQLFTDLEKTIPYNVKVVALHPSVTPESKVVLDMTVASEAQEAMIACLKALENSPLFGEVSQRQTNPPTQSEPLYKLRLTVNYGQKL